MTERQHRLRSHLSEDLSVCFALIKIQEQNKTRLEVQNLLL